MWEEKQTIKKINSAPSTRYMATPGWRDEEEELRNRLAKLKEGGRRKSKSKKIGKSIKKKGKSIRIRSKSIRRKSIRRKSMKMY